MRNKLFFFALFFCFSHASSACNPFREDWRTCRDVRKALADRVDKACLSEVSAQIPLINKEDDFWRLWGDYKICEILGEEPGISVIDEETMDELRVCGDWLIELPCEEVAKKLKQITVEKLKDVGQPPECNPFFQTIQGHFKPLVGE